MTGLKNNILIKNINFRFRAMIICFAAAVVLFASSILIPVAAGIYNLEIAKPSGGNSAVEKAVSFEWDSSGNRQKLLGFHSIERLQDGSVRKSFVDCRNASVHVKIIHATEMRFFDDSLGYKYDNATESFTRESFDKKSNLTVIERLPCKKTGLNLNFHLISLVSPENKLFDELHYEISNGKSGKPMFENREAFENAQTAISVAMGFLVAAMFFYAAAVIFLIMLLYGIFKSVPFSRRKIRPSVGISMLIFGALLTLIDAQNSIPIQAVLVVLNFFGLYLIFNAALSLFDSLSKALMSYAGKAASISTFAMLVAILTIYAINTFSDSKTAFADILGCVTIIMLFIVLVRFKNYSVAILESNRG